MSQIDSNIEIQNQVTDVQLNLTGIPFSLKYRNDRSQGWLAGNTLEIPLSGETVPEGLKRIELEISIAGQFQTQQFSPEPEQNYTFTWDRKDAYGRPVQGKQDVRGRIGYVYDAVYQEPAEFEQSFARFSGVPIEGNETRQEVTLWQDWTRTLGTWDATAQGVGGWQFEIHHSYDSNSQTLYLGDGRQRSSQTLGRVISTVAGNEDTRRSKGDGGPATDAGLHSPEDVAIAPDGSLYIAETGAHRVRCVGQDGMITTVAGTGQRGFSGDSKQATEAQLADPNGIEIDSDGSIYIADSNNGRIRRVSPDGVITTVAGGGDKPPEGVPAIEANISVVDIAITENGALYITGGDRITKVDASGVITTVVDNAEAISITDELLNEGVRVDEVSLFGSSVTSINTGIDDNVYFVDEAVGQGAVYKIGSDGILTRIAGGGTKVVGESDQPLEIKLEYPSDVVEDPEGGLYIAQNHPTDDLNRRIYYLTPNGVISTIAGRQPEEEIATLSAEDEDTVITPGPAEEQDNEEQPNEGGNAGIPALQATLVDPEAITVLPDGTVYFTDVATIKKVLPPLAGLSTTETAIASEEGDQLHVFDRGGRHLRTMNAFTGTQLYDFKYDTEGYLTAIEDGDGNVTRIERGNNENPIAVVSPYGQATALETRDDGMLTKVINPAGGTYEFTYDGDGSLMSITKPEGNTTQFSYDALGRLVREENSAGGQTDLIRSRIEDGFEVDLITGELRESSYVVENVNPGDERRVNSCCGENGIEIITDRNAAMREIMYMEGTHEVIEETPDPRFGMQAPLLGTQIIETPNGLTATSYATESAELDTPGNPLSVQELTNTVEINGKIYSSSFDASQNRFTTETPAGYKSTFTLDQQGRTKSVQLDGLDSLTFRYDDRGRLTQVAIGGQVIDYSYETSEQVSTIANAEGESFGYSYDANGRVSQSRLPSGSSYQFGYDANGNLTKLTMPTGTDHAFSYTAGDLLQEYVPPDNNRYTFSYNRDSQLAELTFPNEKTLTNTYDQNGRLVAQNYPLGTVNLAYNNAQQVTQLTRTTGDEETAQALTFVYDGVLPIESEFSGPASGRFTYQYDDDFLMTTMTLPDGMALPLTRDADGLLTEYGPFDITRNGPASSISRISDGELRIIVEYNNIGRVTTRTHTIAGQQLYRIEYGYDKAGRITEKKETVADTSHTCEYTYDTDGQLTQAERDGTVFERYSYDENGNRVSKQVEEGDRQIARYNVQDQLLKFGDVEYMYDANGFLARRGGMSFTYSVRGELLKVSTENDETITYEYDGLGRRVTRRSRSGRHEFLYGNPTNPFQITAIRDSSGTISTYHYDETGHLFAIRRSEDWYYVATDQIGTPMLVSDASGNVVKYIEHDSFGNVLSDSNSGFQLPIGFAGGLVDPQTKLVRFGFRDYEPVSGRWTARDPLIYKGGPLLLSENAVLFEGTTPLFDNMKPNFYAYLENDPINAIDPLGLQKSWPEKAWDYYGKAKKWWKRGKKAKKAAETAKEVKKTLEDPTKSDPEQAADLMKCVLDWVKIPFWGNEPAKQALDEGLPHAKRSGECGTVNKQGCRQLQEAFSDPRFP